MKIKTFKRDNKGRFLSNSDDKHPMWKGDDASYSAIHHWIKNKKGKALYCSNNINHINRKYNWANISGEYLRDVNDYVPLCISCHKKMDLTKEFVEGCRKRMMGNTNTRKEVRQFTIDGIFIAKFPSMTEAQEKTGVLITSICNMLKGNSKTAGGFIWQR